MHGGPTVSRRTRIWRPEDDVLWYGEVLRGVGRRPRRDTLVRLDTAGKRVAKAHGDRSRRPHRVRRLLSGSTQSRGVNRRSISLIAASASLSRCAATQLSRGFTSCDCTPAHAVNGSCTSCNRIASRPSDVTPWCLFLLEFEPIVMASLDHLTSSSEIIIVSRQFSRSDLPPLGKFLGFAVSQPFLNRFLGR
jgi:hypothetical protein